MPKKKRSSISSDKDNSQKVSLSSLLELLEKDKHQEAHLLLSSHTIDVNTDEEYRMLASCYSRMDFYEQALATINLIKEQNYEDLM